jgi:hypothetical protein
LSQIESARKRAEALLASSTVSEAQKEVIRRDILGGGGGAGTFGSVPPPAVTNFSTLSALSDAYQNLEDAVESADAEPTHDQNLAFVELGKTLEATIAKLAKISGH